MNDTDGLAAETRRLLDAATKGEWGPTIYRGTGLGWDVDGPEAGIRGQFENEPDAALIAAAPRLLAQWLAREDTDVPSVYPDLVLQLRSLSDRSCNAAADIIEQLAAERDRLADENRALREAARAVAFCDSCGEPTHEPNEDCWFMDRSSCAYALNPNGGGTCSFDCRDEPSCMTDGPYPMERLRLVLAAADRGVTDGDRNEGDEE